MSGWVFWVCELCQVGLVVGENLRLVVGEYVRLVVVEDVGLGFGENVVLWRRSG
jgi:hypothetical protein